MRRLVREILYIMNACEMFYDPSKSVLQMLQMLRMLANCECVANEMRMQNMGILYINLIIHITGVSLCLISATGSVKLAYFP